MLLADAAQAVEGKVYALGLGWTFTGPHGTSPMALIVLFEVDWHETNVRHPWRIELHDEDGHALPLPPNDEPFVIEGMLEVGRPPGHPEGAPLVVPFTFSFGPIALAPGKRYVWVMTLDGETRPEWQAAFNMRPLQQ